MAYLPDTLDSLEELFHDAGMNEGNPWDSTRPFLESGDLSPSVSGELLGPLPASLGGYRIIDRLGSGGMGEVLLAHDDSLSRPIALKRIRADRAGDENVRRRFEVEARVTAIL